MALLRPWLDATEVFAFILKIVRFDKVLFIYINFEFVIEIEIILKKS